MAAPRPRPGAIAAWSLLYDGDCGPCGEFAHAVRALDRRGKLRVARFRSPTGRRLLAGWSEERILSAFHLAAPDGRIRSGGDALPALVAVLVPRARGAVATAPVRAAVKLLYEIVASHVRSGSCPAPPGGRPVDPGISPR